MSFFYLLSRRCLTVDGSPPSGDDARLSGVVAGVSRCQRGVAGVGVGGDVGEVQGGDVVGVSLVAVVHKAAVLQNDDNNNKIIIQPTFCSAITGLGQFYRSLRIQNP